MGAEKILIVEPNLKLADFLSTQLKLKGGYESILADSVNTALEVLRYEKVQLVLADQNLQNHSGFELAHEIRREWTTKPEIVMMSSDPRVSLFEAHQVGVSHILRMPVKIEELISVVARVTGQKRRYERVQVNASQHGSIKVDVGSSNQKSFNMEISNIGRGGFFFRVSNDSDLPPVGQIIDFKLKLGMVPEYSFAGRGIVRWVKRTGAETGAGVEFLVIPEESERLIGAFVDLFRIREFVPAD